MCCFEEGWIFILVIMIDVFGLDVICNIFGGFDLWVDDWYYVGWMFVVFEFVIFVEIVWLWLCGEID